MGSVNQETTQPGRAYELALPWGPTLRGVRWGNGHTMAFFLHEPGANRDLDAWGDLPARLSAALNVASLVLDLPGHGLSDDPWEPTRLPEIVSALLAERDSDQPPLFITAGETATAVLTVAADRRVAGVAALSPAPGDAGETLPRSPTTTKLFFAGAQDGDALAVSRQLASSLGGWTVVTSIPTGARGADMLATDWGPRLSEHIVAFARDVFFRQLSSSSLRQRTPPAG